MNEVYERRIRTKKLAMASCLVALSVTIMYIGTVISFLDLTMIAIASVPVYFAVIEMGSYYPIMLYAATSVLSLLLLPDKFSAVVYIAFGGLYPILKEKLEKLKEPFCTLLKFADFTVAAALIMIVSIFVLTPNQTEGYLYYASVVVLEYIAFFIYDFAMTKLISLYINKLRALTGMDKFFK